MGLFFRARPRKKRASPAGTASSIGKKIKAYLENGASSVWIFYRDGTVALHTATGVRESAG
jgi:hypothetical protein